MYKGSITENVKRRSMRPMSITGEDYNTFASYVGIYWCLLLYTENLAAALVCYIVTLAPTTVVQVPYN